MLRSRTKSLLLSVVLIIAFTYSTDAQQARNRIDYAPHMNTDNYPAMYADEISPEVHADRTVTFRVEGPQVRDIRLTGDLVTRISGAEREGIPFSRNDDGLWTLTIGPFEPNLYAYRIVIDGVQVTDPGNTIVGTANQPPFSIVSIPGDGPAFYDAQPVSHGAVICHIYHSDAVDGEREMYVYTPPGYSMNEKYPTLYLLGGSGEVASTWTRFGRVNFIMDNLIAEGLAKPMVIVMPNNQMVHRRSPRESELNPVLLEQDLRNHIIPLVETSYSVLKSPKGRALAGLSMGGRHTQAIGFNSLDLFGSFGVLSAGAVDTEERSATFLNDPAVNDMVDYLFIGQGTNERAARTFGLRDALVNHEIDHEYYEGGDSGHDFITWRHLLYYRFLSGLWR